MERHLLLVRSTFAASRFVPPAAASPGDPRCGFRPRAPSGRAPVLDQATTCRLLGCASGPVTGRRDDVSACEALDRFRRTGRSVGELARAGHARRRGTDRALPVGSVGGHSRSHQRWQGCSRAQPWLRGPANFGDAAAWSPKRTLAACGTSVPFRVRRPGKYASCFALAPAPRLRGPLLENRRSSTCSYPAGAFTRALPRSPAYGFDGTRVGRLPPPGFGAGLLPGGPGTGGTVPAAWRGVEFKDGAEQPADPLDRADSDARRGGEKEGPGHPAPSVFEASGDAQSTGGREAPRRVGMLEASYGTGDADGVGKHRGDRLLNCWLCPNAGISVADLDARRDRRAAARGATTAAAWRPRSLVSRAERYLLDFTAADSTGRGDLRAGGASPAGSVA